MTIFLLITIGTCMVFLGSSVIRFINLRHETATTVAIEDRIDRRRYIISNMLALLLPVVFGLVFAIKAETFPHNTTVEYMVNFAVGIFAIGLIVLAMGENAEPS